MRWRRRAGILLPLLLVAATDPLRAQVGTQARPPSGAAAPASDGCVKCHGGIEEIHPGYPLTCVACHGGDGAATTKEKAHVLPKETPPGDERVLPLGQDLAWQQFVNPSNLRVARRVCGDCHDPAVGN